MDDQKRRKLVERIVALQALPETMPVVPLEAFFDGNDDLGSIGCNLGDDHPGMSRFFEILAEVEHRPEVQDVLVGIYETMDEDGSWPFSETVYILTSAPASAVREWVAELQPSEVVEGFLAEPPPGLPAVQAGMNPVRLWWD